MSSFCDCHFALNSFSVSRRSASCSGVALSHVRVAVGAVPPPAGRTRSRGFCAGCMSSRSVLRVSRPTFLPSTMYFSFLSGVRRFSLIAVSTASVMRARVIAALSSCNFVIAATASSSVAVGARPSFVRIFSMFFLMLLFGGCSVFSSCTVRFRSGRWSLSSPAARVSSFPS